MKIELNKEGLELTVENDLEEVFIQSVLDINDHNDGTILFKNIHNKKTASNVPTTLKADTRYTLKKVITNINITSKIKSFIDFNATDKATISTNNRAINKLARLLFDKLVDEDLLDIEQNHNQLEVKLRVINKNL